MPAGNPDQDREDRRVLSRQARPPDRTWAYGAHPDTVADVYVPPGSGPLMSTVVLVHGGFWRPDFDRVHVRPLAAHLAGLGHTVVSLEYRRRPGDPDTTVLDLRTALTRLSTETWLPATSMQALGHSAGGHLVLLLAADPATPLQSAVALAPVADLADAYARHLDVDAVEAFVGADPALRSDLDPARIDPPTIPVTIVHGGRDSIVPIAVTKVFLEQLPADRRPSLVILPETGHFELIDPTSRAMAEVESALDRLAGPTSGTG
jgi:acetyl esterase/lipase